MGKTLVGELLDKTGQPVPLKVTERFPTRHLARQRLIEARQEKVSYYMLLGWTQAAIAEELSVAPSLIHYDMAAVRQKWQQQSVDNVAEAAVLDLARLDYAINQMLPRLAHGEYKAAENLIKCIELRARILGYQHGVSFDVEQYIRQMAEANGYDPSHAVEIAAKISVTLR